MMDSFEAIWAADQVELGKCGPISGFQYSTTSLIAKYIAISIEVLEIQSEIYLYLPTLRWIGSRRI